MISAELQAEVEALANDLGVTPDQMLRETLQSKREEMAYAKLESAVKEAEESGFRDVNLDTWAEDFKRTVRAKHADSPGA